MAAKPRPFFKSRIGDLEALAEASKTKKLLREIRSELCHRKSQRAIKLKARIDELLAQPSLPPHTSQPKEKQKPEPEQHSLIDIKPTPEKRRTSINLEKTPQEKPQEIVQPKKEPEPIVQTSDKIDSAPMPAPSFWHRILGSLGLR